MEFRAGGVGWGGVCWWWGGGVGVYGNVRRQWYDFDLKEDKGLHLSSV